jgi:hypothetical protein
MLQSVQTADGTYRYNGAPVGISAADSDASIATGKECKSKGDKVIDADRMQQQVNRKIGSRPANYRGPGGSG